MLAAVTALADDVVVFTEGAVNAGLGTTASWNVLTTKLAGMAGWRKESTTV